MGTRIRILKFTPEGEGGDSSEIHALGLIGSDSGTLCGIPFCDEAEEIEECTAPINCSPCISVLESRQEYVKRNRKWY